MTVGTLYERSKIPLHKWLAATQLMMSSKKGMSALADRPHARRSPKRRLVPDASASAKACAERSLEPIGGEGKIVEADETFVGGKESNKHEQAQAAEHRRRGKEAVFRW